MPALARVGTFFGGSTTTPPKPSGNGRYLRTAVVQSGTKRLILISSRHGTRRPHFATMAEVRPDRNMPCMTFDSSVAKFWIPESVLEMIFISTRGSNSLRRHLRRPRAPASPHPCSGSPLPWSFPVICPEQGRNFPCYLRVEHSLYCSGIGFKHMELRFFSRRRRHEGSAIFPVFLPITGKKQQSSRRSGNAPAARNGAGRGLAAGRKRHAWRLARFRIHRLDAVGFPPRQRDDPGRLSDDGSGSA